MAKTTFWDVIIRTLEAMRIPLSAEEIWQNANEHNLLGDFVTTGKTPIASIAARCYTHINENGEKSEIVKASENPTRFALRKFERKAAPVTAVESNPPTVKRHETKTSEMKFMERDLHPLLVSYAYSNSHFKARVKTIFHEVSTKKQKGQNKWLHPDLVGVQFPFDDYHGATLEIQKHLSISSIKLYSFEMKIDLNFSNLRECYFQAVSNSSWANEGYLVALHINEDTSFRDEIRRLNNAFGIGIIQLDAENVAESQILFPAKTNTGIDWDTVNRLCSENEDFHEFLKLISEDCAIEKVKSKYDEIIKPEELELYVKRKNIQ